MGFTQKGIRITNAFLKYLDEPNHRQTNFG